MTDTAEDTKPASSFGAAEGGPLAQYGGDIPPAPGWFTRAVAAPYETGRVEVQGAGIEYQRWGKRGAPGLLLVHGNGAHSHWWDFIAPYFSGDYNVAALTFSGMGDSDWREHYSMATFGAEQIAVAEEAGLFEGPVKPIIIAHSFGGFVSIGTAARQGERFGGLIVVDSPISPPERPHKGPDRSGRPNRVYADLAAALGRFRLAPPQDCETHYAVDYIARWSLKKTDGGFTWKFDPSIWRHFHHDGEPSELLKAAKCRLAMMRGEDSALVTDEVRDYAVKLLEGRVPYISIPHAYHHVLLDQPLAFIAALRALLADWETSQPVRLPCG